MSLVGLPGPSGENGMPGLKGKFRCGYTALMHIVLISRRLWFTWYQWTAGTTWHERVRIGVLLSTRLILCGV